MGHNSCEFISTAGTIAGTICTIIIWKVSYFSYFTWTVSICLIMHCEIDFLTCSVGIADETV
jgi:hypothetical protein